ncbi:MAG: DUF4332 domain-containing protein [Hyphomicrobiaceae bacterium]
MTNRLTGLTQTLLGLGRFRYAATLPHKIAFASLAALTGPSADEWRRTILLHADVYTLGADAPDTDFKDFKNHVLFPRDGYWGGAPDKAQIWYRNLVSALKRQEWETAAYCAGVLTHYVSDVTDPFNTQWSDAGGALHAAVRRTFRESFESLAADTRALPSDNSAFILAPEPDFLARALAAAADRANAGYEKAIAHYDLSRGTSDPRAGFDPVGQRLAAELMAQAVALNVAILARAIADAEVAPPVSQQSWKTIIHHLATAPLGMLARWRHSAQERGDVQAMLDEVVATGGADATLPEHDRAIRDLYRKEIVANRKVVPIAKVFPFEPSAESVKRVERMRRAAQPTDTTAAGEVVELNRARVAVEPPRPAPQRIDAPPIRQRVEIARQIADEVAEEQALEAAMRSAVGQPAFATPSNVVALPQNNVALAATPTSLQAAPVAQQPAVAEATVEVSSPSVIEPPAATTVATLVSTDAAATSVTNHILLSADQDIVDAPSIGPKMAELFRAVGIDTVEDFLRAHPIALAARLEQKHIDAEQLEAWQDQARLVMSVPGLRGTHAQLLVGSGYRSLDAVAAADISKLCSDVLTFATSKPGQRILRDGAAPSVERVRAWAEAARSVKAA